MTPRVEQIASVYVSIRMVSWILGKYGGHELLLQPLRIFGRSENAYFFTPSHEHENIGTGFFMYFSGVVEEGVSTTSMQLSRQMCVSLLWRHG
jgi:hypothetical protein